MASQHLPTPLAAILERLCIITCGFFRGTFLASHRRVPRLCFSCASITRVQTHGHMVCTGPVLESFHLSPIIDDCRDHYLSYPSIMTREEYLGSLNLALGIWYSCPCRTVEALFTSLP